MINPKVDEDGNKEWRNSKGQLHRENGPAWEDSDGGKYWLQNDEYHREDGPAIIWADGSKFWWVNGKHIQ
jgi:hypothetical protein